MESKSEEEKLVNLLMKYIETDEYASSKRGKIINRMASIENILTDIIAWVFYPEEYPQGSKAKNLLDKNRTELKSLLLRKIDFREKIESLKDILLVKKPDILENNRSLIMTIIKELDRARNFRNLIAHSELDMSELKSNTSEKIEKCLITEYKKGKIFIHLIDDERINAESEVMYSVQNKLYKLFALIKNDTKLLNTTDKFLNEV